MKKLTLKSGKILQITQDEHPLNPRVDWDNLGTMICLHGRYDLGDKHSYRHSDFNDWEGLKQLKQAIMKDIKEGIILPLYLYDHSGITISYKPFSSRFDSGQVGWIYCSLEDACKNWPCKTFEDTMPDWLDTSKQITLREATQRALEGEVETYDQYLRGDVYRFKVIERKDCVYCGAYHERELDSCGGFFGDNIKTNGILDHIDDEILDLDKL